MLTYILLKLKLVRGKMALVSLHKWLVRKTKRRKTKNENFEFSKNEKRNFETSKSCLSPR